MKKQMTEKIVYEPNDTVKVTVSNKPVHDDETGLSYERKVTINVSLGWNKEKLTFTDDQSIADFLASVDVEDPQQALEV